MNTCKKNKSALREKARIALSCIFALAAVYFILNHFPGVNSATAEVKELYGRAWSPNIGLIEFNCTNNGVTCDDPPNGVGDFKVFYYLIEPTMDMQWFGYAYAETVGKIYFGPNEGDTDIPVNIEDAPNEPKVWAQYDASENKVIGWAKAVEADPLNGWDGWIKMSKDAADSGADYGVKSGGQWEIVAGADLPVSRIGHSSVVAGDYVFVIGGVDSTYAIKNTVYRAKINADGTFGSWFAVTPLPEAKIFHTSVAVPSDDGNYYIYVIGGADKWGTLNQGDVSKKVFYAKVDKGTGSIIGQWTQTAQLSERSYLNSAVSDDGNVYLVSGVDKDGTPHKVYRSVVSTSIGELGSWTVASDVYLRGRAIKVSAGGDKYIYNMGSVIQQAKGENDKVWYTKINANGSLGAWSQTTSLPEDMVSFYPATSGENIFAIGKSYDGTADIAYASVVSSGGASGWMPINVLPEGRVLGSALSHFGNVYIISGREGSSFVKDVLVGTGLSVGTFFGDAWGGPVLGYISFSGLGYYVATAPPPPPAASILSFDVTPPSFILQDGSSGNAVLSWSTMGMDHCVASCESGICGGWTGAGIGTDGSMSVGVTETATYKLTCYDQPGDTGFSDVKTETVTVTEGGFTLGFDATSQIEWGTDSTLHWAPYSKGYTVDSCAAIDCSGGSWCSQWITYNPSALGGSMSVSDIADTTTFILSCTDSNGTIVKESKTTQIRKAFDIVATPSATTATIISGQPTISSVSKITIDASFCYLSNICTPMSGGGKDIKLSVIKVTRDSNHSDTEDNGDIDVTDNFTFNFGSTVKQKNEVYILPTNKFDTGVDFSVNIPGTEPGGYAYFVTLNGEDEGGRYNRTGKITINLTKLTPEIIEQ